MAIDAVVRLEQLRCISLRNGEQRTEPYVWLALIRIDDNTLTTVEQLQLVTPIRESARIVIKDSMRAGETAAIPSRAGVLSVRFEDNLTIQRLLLIVTLLEMDETPKAAMEAGFAAFSRELRPAVAEQIVPFLEAEREQDPELREIKKKEITDAITKRVNGRVKSAIESGLTAWEKAKVIANLLHLDDSAGSDFLSFGSAERPVAATPFTLSFEATQRIAAGFVSSSEYEIRGRLQVRPVLIERCQAQVDAVNAAQGVVDAIEREIAALQQELKGGGDGPRRPRNEILDDLERLRDEELGPAVAALKSARTALQSCRNGQAVASDPRDAVAAMA